MVIVPIVHDCVGDDDRNDVDGIGNGAIDDHTYGHGHVSDGNDGMIA